MPPVDTLDGDVSILATHEHAEARVRLLGACPVLTMVVDRPFGAMFPTWQVLAAQNPAKVTPLNASAGRPAHGFLIHAYITNLPSTRQP